MICTRGRRVASSASRSPRGVVSLEFAVVPALPGVNGEGARFSPSCLPGSTDDSYCLVAVYWISISLYRTAAGPSVGFAASVAVAGDASSIGSSRVRWLVLAARRMSRWAR